MQSRHQSKDDLSSGPGLALSSSAAMWLSTNLTAAKYPLMVLSMIGIGMMARAAYRDLHRLKRGPQQDAGS
jgi:hypothetical protein